MKTMKKNGGFTLVELIVVIAILAILAAVAIPAYSGYIEKANKAGDETLLSAVNRAFYSACLDQAMDPYQIANAVYDMNNNVVTGAVTKEGVALDANALRASFALYFEDNNDQKFKVIKSVRFDKNKALFVEASGALTEDTTFSYGGAYLNVTKEQVADIMNSPFGKHSSETLVDMVGGASGSLNEIAGGGGTGWDNMMKNPAFLKQSALALGIEVKDGDTAWMAELNSTLDGMAKKNAGEGATQAQIDAELLKIKSNAVILYVAQNTNSTDATNWLTSISTGGSGSILTNTGNSATAADGFAQAALAYAMYASYKGDGGTYKPEDVVNALDNDAEFKKYLADQAALGEGSAALKGYLGAMDALGDNTKVDTDNAETNKNNQQIAQDLVNNGLANDDLAAIFGAAMGQ